MIEAPQVAILMSVYNGKRYLRQQIESILQQTYSNLIIFIRDDGSDEDTKTILKTYEQLYNFIYVDYGNNVGVARSFYQLLQKRELQKVQYVAFSDQDDVWLPDKVERAIEVLKKGKQDVPKLYCCRPQLVNESLEKVADNIHSYKIKPSFGNALIENVCFGCTQVFNRALLKKMSGKMPEYMIMHDWWVYLLASCFGEVYYDSKCYILYRQHNYNSVGMKTNYRDELIGRLKRLKGQKGERYIQAQEFASLYPECIFSRPVIKDFLGYKETMKKTIKVLFSAEIKRQRRMDNFLFKILFAIHYV